MNETVVTDHVSLRSVSIGTFYKEPQWTLKTRGQEGQDKVQVVLQAVGHS